MKLLLAFIVVFFSLQGFTKVHQSGDHAGSFDCPKGDSIAEAYGNNEVTFPKQCAFNKASQAQDLTINMGAPALWNNQGVPGSSGPAGVRSTR